MGTGSSKYKIGANGHGTSGAKDDGFSMVNGYTTKIHADRQKKHIPGAKNYIKGRSIFNGSVAEAQELINVFAGTGEWIQSNRERIDFERPIGIYKSDAEDSGIPTTVGIIMYSKTGAHIVPARPRKQ